MVNFTTRRVQSQNANSSASTAETTNTNFSLLVKHYQPRTTEQNFLRALIKTCDKRKEEINGLPFLQKTKNGPGMALWQLTKEIHEIGQELWKLLRETQLLMMTEKDWAILEVVLKVIELRIATVASEADLRNAVITLRDTNSFFNPRKRKKMKTILTDGADGLKEARNFTSSYRIGVSCEHRRTHRLMNLSCETIEPPTLPTGQVEVEKIKDTKMKRPLLPKRFSTGMSNVSAGKIRGAHPPKVEL